MARNYRFSKFFAFLLLTLSGRAPAAPELKLESIRHYQISIEAGLYGLLRRGNELISLPKEGDFYIRSSYKPQAKESDLGFGSLHNPLEGSERVSLAAGEKARRLRAAVELESYLLFLDSSKRQLLVWSEERKEWHLPAELVLDQIRPPRDQGGEPPDSEVQRARSRLQAEYRAATGDPELLIGMTALPKKWRSGGETSQFLLALRLPSSPLLTVRCEARHFGRCIAQRACFVKGLSRADLLEMQGVSLHEAANELWMGLPRQGKILRMSLSSCLSVKPKGTIDLGPELKHLSSLNFDGEGNLWATVSEPTAQLSGSLFRWDKESVARLLP